MDVANALLPTYVVTLLFFAGFLLRFDDMPPWWKWYSYINFLRYAWSAVMVNNFKEGDPQLFPGPGSPTVLQYYGLDGVSKWASLGFESLFFLVFFVCTWLTLSYKKYSSR